MEILSNFMDPSGGGEMLGRYVHYLSGVTWIGLLYYFNFVQTPAFAEVSDATRSEAMRTITWRALWWFRFGALLTFLSGVWILGIQKYLGSEFDAFWKTPQGTSILIGAGFGTVMFLNVWLVIWPKQQIVIGSARRVADGGEADPAAAGAAKAAARASRTNTLFSIPMLFFMGFTSHYSGAYNGADGNGPYAIVILVFLAILAVIELSALGLIGGLDSPLCKRLFDRHKDTIVAGFVVWAVLLILGLELNIGRGRPGAYAPGCAPVPRRAARARSHRRPRRLAHGRRARPARRGAGRRGRPVLRAAHGARAAGHRGRRAGASARRG